jgi:hypothetical protein
MTARLKKEFRGLLLPWAVLAAAGALLAVLVCFRASGPAREVTEFFAGLTVFAGCVGFGFLAASPFGSEYQQRTMPLLLAQPVERFRLWIEKHLALVTAGVIHGLSWIVFGLLNFGIARMRSMGTELDVGDWNGLWLAGAVALATICSAGFWAMVARSTIGGAGVSVVFQFLTTLIVTAVLHKVYGDALEFNAPVVTRIIVIGGLVYSGVFLLLSWWKFARLELRDLIVGEGIELSGAVVRGRWWSKWLVCRAQGNSLNLMRKELRLQKPIFIIAVVFTGCWLLTMGLEALWPDKGFEEFLSVLLCFYVPLALILAGCLTIGEEKTLGVAVWQLTWPVSARRLWAVKLGAANITGLALGFVLPCVLGLWTLAALPVAPGLDWPTPGKLGFMLLLAWVTVLVNFWAGTLVTNTVRAALLTLSAWAIGSGCVALGTWSATELSGPEGGLQSGLLIGIMTHFQLSPIPLVYAASPLMWLGVTLVGGLFVILLLKQSLNHFRWAQQPREVLVRQAFMLGILLLVTGFWASDFLSSAEGLDRSQPVTELQQGLSHFSSKHSLWNTQGVRTVTLDELRQETADLSPTTEAWLKGAAITCRSVGNGFSLPGIKAWWATFGVHVRFPNGEVYEFSYVVPVPPKPE